jgi:hypothetical protein
MLPAARRCSALTLSSLNAITLIRREKDELFIGFAGEFPKDL